MPTRHRQRAAALQGSCWNVTDDGLEHLSNLDLLTDLHLEGVQKITGAGLEHVARLGLLVRLALVDCGNVAGGQVMQHPAPHTFLPQQRRGPGQSTCPGCVLCPLPRAPTPLVTAT